MNGNRCFFDYSDYTDFIEEPKKYDYYFKRSLLQDAYQSNVRPLNFQINFSYKPLKLLSKLPLKVFENKKSREELKKALDYFSLFTNDSHQSKKIENLLSNEISDYGGRVIFMTRLWRPNKKDENENERRILQNNFRINACRIISKNFPNSITGVFPDNYAMEIAKDVLLDLHKTKKQSYLRELRKADICIADDGLQDTPGWKIGEYALLNKAIVSTPIKTVVEEFKQKENYISLEDRNDFKSLPDAINELIKSKTYLQLKENNRLWSNKYLKADSYIENILKQCN